MQTKQPQPPALAKVEKDGFSITLNDHSCDVSAVMTAMLEDDGIRSRLTETPLSARDVSRLSFLAGLHDAGKANILFQELLKFRLIKSNRGRKPPKTKGHCEPLLDIVTKPSADWQPLISGDVDPASLEPCMAVHRVLRPTRRSRWFSGKTEVLYWGALLDHHRKPRQPIRLRVSNVTPDPALWRDTDHYSPRAALNQLVRAMGAAHPRVHERGKGRLPSDRDVIRMFAYFVQLADKLSSKHGRSRGARVPWAKALVEAEKITAGSDLGKLAAGPGR